MSVPSPLALLVLLVSLLLLLHLDLLLLQQDLLLLLQVLLMLQQLIGLILWWLQSIRTHRSWMFDELDSDLGAVFLRVAHPVAVVPDPTRQFPRHARRGGRALARMEVGRGACAGRGEGLPEASVVDLSLDIHGAGPGSSAS